MLLWSRGAPLATIPRVTDVLIVHNPGSRRGRDVAAVVRRILAESEDAGAADSSGDAIAAVRAEFVSITDLDRQEAPSGRVVAIGGDGTINAALSWLHSRGADRPLGIVPSGTGNNLARGLGLSLDAETAARLALAGSETRRIDGVVYQAVEDGAEHGDAGETGGAPAGRDRLIVQSGALGFPAQIGARYDALRRHRVFRFLAAPLGPIVYVLLALVGLVGQKLREWSGDPLLEVRCRFRDLDVDERSVVERAFAVFVGNERTLGGGFVPCPRAEFDDGRVDLCIVRAGTGASYLGLFRRVLRGTHLDLADTVIYHQTRGPVELELSAPAGFLADGDIWIESDRYRLTVLPGRFAIVTG